VTADASCPFGVGGFTSDAKGVDKETSADLPPRRQGLVSCGGRAGRLATLGLAAIFCFVAGFSLLRSHVGENKIEQGRQSERTSHAYEEARFALAARISGRRRHC
jgi:hypothetical protein